MFGSAANTVSRENANSGSATSVTLSELVRLRGSVRAVKRPTGRQVKAPAIGGNQSRALGRGLDFSEVREYAAGDDVRTIDWKVTARSGKPHTKIYNEERERPFLLAVDLRSTMFFATRVAFKSVCAARLAAMLAWAAASNRDRVGGLVFSDQGMKQLKPVAGSRGVTRLLNEIVTMHSRVKGTSATPEQHRSQLDDAFQHLRRSAHTGSSVCVLTDFSGFDTIKGGAVNQLLRHNHVAACQIYDPLEARLPSPARYTISDGAQRTTLDTSSAEYRASYSSAFNERTENISQLFSGQGNSFFQCLVSDSLGEVANRMIRSLPGSM